MSNIDTVRINIADRVTFYREQYEQSDGANKYFKLDHENVSALPAPVVRVDGTIKTVTTDYTVDYVNGSITLVAAPTLGAVVTVEYSATVWTDAELQIFLDGANESITLASARALYAWAADAARIAYKETRSGGGGMGSVTIDTSVRAQQMRLTADALMKQYSQFEGTDEPAEGLTETAWTEQIANRRVTNWILDNDPVGRNG